MNATHNFYDINKFPKEYGIIVFPISIARAQNGTGQDPKQCLEYLYHFSPSKVSAPKIGLNVVYSDSLYLHSDLPAASLKERFSKIILAHKNALSRLLDKDRERFQIQHAFSYEVWNQLYLSYQGDFTSDFARFRKMYDADPLFQKYVAEDAKYAGRELDDNQTNFFLEEHLIVYSLSKRKISLPNEYIMGREEWVLVCYPGVPLKAQIYTMQMNPFNLNDQTNPYQNHWYDLESRRLTDMSKVDLEVYNYQYPN
ncbi:MAG: hypothetical protein R3B60_02620 [Candidatus Paceibacterota bacterium]